MLFTLTPALSLRERELVGWYSWYVYMVGAGLKPAPTLFIQH